MVYFFGRFCLFDDPFRDVLAGEDAGDGAEAGPGSVASLPEAG